MNSGRDSSGRPSRVAQWELRMDQRRPLPEVIEEKLRELIDNGVLPEGERLPNEPELARRMGVARSSVRTALQRLEVLRVVEVRRGRGWFVRRKPADYLPGEFMEWMSERRFRLSEELEVRMALEGMAASLAAARATEGEIDDIAKLSKEHIAAFADVDELLRTDEAFHEAIFRASRNDLLLASYQMLIPELAEVRKRSFTGRGVPARSGTEHDNVVNFLKRGDSAGARAAMMTHLLGPYHEVQAAGDHDGMEQPAHLTTFVGIEDEPDWPPR
ncbi:MAG TPA: FCD domain-containing protein [Pseudonocardiaceae bacterium]|nr:FCD domain-containing protein [Pseudonocardiaceae bacterium]